MLLTNETRVDISMSHLETDINLVKSVDHENEVKVMRNITG